MRGLDLTFAVSVDNLTVDANCPEIIDFKTAVDRQIMRFRQQGLPDRARRFKEALTLLAVERSADGASKSSHRQCDMGDTKSVGPPNRTGFYPGTQMFFRPQGRECPAHTNRNTGRFKSIAGQPDRLCRDCKCRNRSYRYAIFVRARHKLANAAGCNAGAVADYVLDAIYQCQRLESLINGATVGLVGYGAVGQHWQHVSVSWGARLKFMTPMFRALRPRKIVYAT